MSLKRLTAAALQHHIWIGTWLALVAGWEVAAHLVPRSQLQGAPLVPSWEYIFTSALKSLSGSWTLPYFAPNPAYGGKETYLGAFLAIGYHSYQTLLRLVLGLVIGVVVGLLSGFLISYWSWFRRLLWTPMNFLRMVPLLAAIPLFQFWLGANMIGTTIFIGFGVWVLVVVATINAVRNVPDRYIESARTLGATRRRAYLTVVMPAALPELRTALLLASGLSWSLAVGAEYLGLPNGLGSIMATAEAFTNTGRLMIIALLIAFYALITFLVLDALLRRLLRWMPSSEVHSAAERVTGAAAIAGPGDATITARE